jgi:hypothetical protein
VKGTDVPLSKDEIINSLRTFKSRRDDLLHEDVATFDHHLARFLEFCSADPITRSVLEPLESRSSIDLDQWWDAASQRPPKLLFPSDSNDEIALRYRLIRSAQSQPNRIFHLGVAHHQSKLSESVELFRTLIVRPFVDDLSHRLGSAADLATPEARDAQAVPLDRIPSSSEIKLFLSHKSVDKPLVYRYYRTLKLLGFDPWLDESNMPVGSNLERELLRGFEQSCAAVFFITENFIDQAYLATEIEYAILQKRKKGKKFSIITLRYTNASAVPGLLTPYIYKDVANDLEGFESLIRALPVELGPIRWKLEVI